MLTCKQYEDLRREYLPSKYFESPNLHKLVILMSSKQEAVIKASALYIYHSAQVSLKSNILYAILRLDFSYCVHLTLRDVFQTWRFCSFGAIFVVYE